MNLDIFKSSQVSFINYYEQIILPCQSCSNDNNIQSHFGKYEKLPPFIGQNQANVMIIGHSPRVRTNSDITVTLDLKEKSVIKKYIVEKILDPLNISLQQCIATNTIKCLTDKLPEDIIISGKRTFMVRAYRHCRIHLENEISIIQPTVIISLSERVSTLLQHAFCPNSKMAPLKEIFGTICKLQIQNREYIWIPVAHIPKARAQSVYFPLQTQRLFALRDKIEALIG